MSNDEFIAKCKQEVLDYTLNHMDVTDKPPEEPIEVYVVWSVKALQNHKALLSTTVPDGMYYECTYNGDKQQLYFDAYKKFENRCIQM